ncbi:dTDP-4-dehydrorhamnose reductase [Paenibacillus qinlingensis]|uniref:dTDP-4-dehydrorhamnose reductase n=1 Tax=Paenibacillus qinlingensis TaxID=1837343 RepID=A0ABU1NXL1_9BACL|nr:dTDP-4-dehydrorhamnose reductase [Paenibacillus qinlingensis]MDR6552200.1 dTDP-4-dehydrorhamnose reductase [Paenibacillus qinlingensis]
MKILLFGGFGLLGNDIYSFLTECGHSVFRFQKNELNLLDISLVREMINEINPEIIINSAGYTNVNGAELNYKDAIDGNVKSLHLLVEVISKLDIPLIYFSTDYIFDGVKNIPYVENDFPNPLNFYGWTKFMAEQVIQANLEQFYIIRTAWLFGNNGNCFPKTIITMLKNKQKIRVVSDQIGSPTYTMDIARMIPNIFKMPFGIYHLSNKGEVSWYHYSKLIAKYGGFSTDLIEPIKSEENASVPKRPSYSVLDSSKIVKCASSEIRGFEEALKEFMLILV